ncbi:hypothetical protein NIES25_36790 [Nostoc linckia NIES-25]|nr:hypothetical protein NIES25_36790 [Nostoc linckia NIES-25]
MLKDALATQYSSVILSTTRIGTRLILKETGQSNFFSWVWMGIVNQ